MQTGSASIVRFLPLFYCFLHYQDSKGLASYTATSNVKISICTQSRDAATALSVLQSFVMVSNPSAVGKPCEVSFELFFCCLKSCSSGWSTSNNEQFINHLVLDGKGKQPIKTRKRWPKFRMIFLSTVQTINL